MTKAETFIRSALDAANTNALRLALYQATGDESLVGLETEKVAVRGGAFFTSRLTPAAAAILRERALAYLLAEQVSPPPPADGAELRRLMELFGNRPLSDSEFRMGREELAFDEMPRGVEWTRRPDASVLGDSEVVIIGAGIGGLATAVLLERLGIRYTVLERQSEIGGVWATNRYPDVRVDTNSYFYQFSFEKQYPWSEFYASGPETRKYLQHVATKHGVLPHVVLEQEVIKAVWDEDAATWHLDVRSPAGAITTRDARFVVSASGLFSTPKLPDIDGIGTFAGGMSHTARWDGSVKPEGADVALIGNGSTGTQILPYLARVARSVTVFQRTPSWLAGLDGYRDEVTPETQWLFETMPFYWNWFCYSFFASSSGLQDAESYDEDWIRDGGTISRANDELRESMTRYVSEKLAGRPDLMEACLPKYAPLGRRPVVDNGWYDALLQRHVSLVTERIDRIEPDAIVTADGERHRVDAIVLAAGFEVERYFSPVTYQGRDGRTLDELWQVDGPRSYLGVAMPGFPNLFTIYGPNASPRAGGYYTWAELWARYIVNSIVRVIESDDTSIEVRQDVYDEYNSRLDASMKGLIWETESTGGYYLNHHGRVGVKMPWRVEDYFEWIAHPNPDDYVAR